MAGEVARIDRKEITTHGEHFTAPLSQAAPFSESVSRHHRPFYDDYDEAKAHIAQAIGDISEFEVFGNNVVIAVFCRPDIMKVKMTDGSDGAVYLPVKEIKEDWWQHKAGMIIKLGPNAFRGDDSYYDAKFGLFDRDGELIKDSGRARRPQIGEWIFANASSGVQISLRGEGASRPQGIDRARQPMDLFEWDGWPCRIIGDDTFYGRITKPHGIV
jgi:hypothetical protein